MARKRSRHLATQRDGVILLIVISLLVLFSLVGLCFVVYAEGQANNARIWREKETLQRPDMDPEMLLAYFLGQFIYGTNDANSALKNLSLAENLYGAAGGKDPYQGIPYTYPDGQNPYLAAVKGGDLAKAATPGTPIANSSGAVLLPSFVGPNRPPIAANVIVDAASPQPTTVSYGNVPFKLYVKNLADSPGVLLPTWDGAAAPTFAPFDSTWLDLGHPSITMPDGRKVKPLFAPLVMDMDGRINVNVHGNVRGGPVTSGTDPTKGVHTSNQGWGPWEVSLEKIFSQSNPPSPQDARALFFGDQSALQQPKIQSRYTMTANGGPWGNAANTMMAFFPAAPPNVPLGVQGPFYAPSDWDGKEGYRDMVLPGAPVPVASPSLAASAPLPVASCFPFYGSSYDGANVANAGRQHPMLYSFFNPEKPYYYLKSPPIPNMKSYGRVFPISSMEAMLRYRDTGSPAMTSDLFYLCPSLADPRVRHMLTTHSFDLDQAAAASAQKPQLESALKAVAAGLGRFGLQAPNLVPYDPTAPGMLPANYPVALKSRIDLAQKIFDRLTMLSATPAAQVAQLAVNIVDFIAPDDYMTVWQWNGKDYVIGTKLPRLVLNEVYAEVAPDDPQNPPMGGPPAPLLVRYWIELHNPHFSPAIGGQGNPWMQSESGDARLWVGTDVADTMGYPVYKILIYQESDKGPAGDLRYGGNTLGDPAYTDPMNPMYKTNLTLKTTVDNFQSDGSVKNTLPDKELGVVHPGNGSPDRSPTTPGDPGGNVGYYLIGPGKDSKAMKDPLTGTGAGVTSPAFPCKDPTKPPIESTNRVKTTIDSKKNKGLEYTYDSMSDPKPNKLRPWVILQRLACPDQKPQDDATKPDYNPYVTVDYMEPERPQPAPNSNDPPQSNGVHVNDGQIDKMKKRTGDDWPDSYATGRNQPYAADASQQVKQFPRMANADQPQHSLYLANVQQTAAGNPKGSVDPGPIVFSYDWLMFANRPLISPIELLQVSKYKPHELTQLFITGGTANGLDGGAPNPAGKHSHRAGWFDPNGIAANAAKTQDRLYRLFEYIQAGRPLQYVALGGRTLGKVNINTVYDRAIFQALADAQPSNFFVGAGGPDDNVNPMFDAIYKSRTPGSVAGNGIPGPNDKPFRSSADYLEDTLFRSAGAPGGPRLFELTTKAAPPTLPPEAMDHPYLRFEMLNKMYNNLTTRSNVFAVWLTVGFFEEIQGAGAAGKQYREVGLAQSRHVRHRMFSIIDRSALTVAFTPAPGPAVPVKNVPAARPWILPGLTEVDQAGQKQITLPTGSVGGDYEGQRILIKDGDYLVVDTGQNQEVVQVNWNPGTPDQFTATFVNPHPHRFAISNALLGNPGPQPRFDMRNPAYQGVLRWFSIIE